ncbi:DEAD/DEAH box helicase [Cytobacillus kochii]|uniref:DEAD/DEAH box helicase n=1 Tax=Cytobacillus kochii TaxID=859143 RepID=UPI00203C9A11|nr:DEAD/DEAH box helicase [Cytobacillus kochii]MCM3321266.1 DEAD/DEAH box helicase [Cytobacillus kochii]MCM3343900.1 DEAD/DEAH box helicase [Cytobacillus kochii]
MKQLEDIHRQAIEYTKMKIYEDIDYYLGANEQMLSFSQYIKDRAPFLAQVWQNVWSNKATNKLSRFHKKEYLKKKSYVIEDMNKKTLNQAFRKEVIEFRPLNVNSLLHSIFADQPEKWAKRYAYARERYLQEEKERQIKQERYAYQEFLCEEAEQWLSKNSENLFLTLRHKLALKLKTDLANRVKYHETESRYLEEPLVEVGPFIVDDYPRVEDFFEEFTGNLHKVMIKNKWYFEYETYYFEYEQMVGETLHTLIQQALLLQLGQDNIDKYQSLFHHSLTGEKWLDLIDWEDLIPNALGRIMEDYVNDLLTIANEDFDLEEQRSLYEIQVKERKMKRKQEERERRQKEEQQQRMLNDIFASAYESRKNIYQKFVLHIGETNTGKTFQALEKMKAAPSGLYLAPLRLLALEVYEKLNNEGTPCSLKTGEEERETSGATHLACTVEMFYEKDDYDVIVIDESQMISDKDRGYAWFKAITKANAREVHIIASKNAEAMLLQLIGDSNVEIHRYKREAPLEVDSEEFTLKNVKKGDALICFSRKRVLETASMLQRKGHQVSMIYGSMPPETRKKQVNRFTAGQSDVIVSTDAIGMGLNLPIRRIVFLETEKFDGTKRRTLTSQEVKQIAGRAGRKGIYPVGRVAFFDRIKLMSSLLSQVDAPIESFAIAPTSAIFDRFLSYYRDLGKFFELWDLFESPKGTKKATLSEERELYELVRGTEIEARMPLKDLYSFLHLPFSKKEADLIRQWEQAMYSIIDHEELPEPRLRNRNLEDLEYSYKAIGLHLLFLYKLGQHTEAIYWERVRDDISNHVFERLDDDIANMKKTCKRCGKSLAWDHAFNICDDCHKNQPSRRRRYYKR